MRALPCLRLHGIRTSRASAMEAINDREVHVKTQAGMWGKTVFGLMLMGAGVLRCAAVEPAGPVQLVVIASEQRKCSAMLYPGAYGDRVDFGKVFPDTQFIYKGPLAPDETGLLYQSCEMTVRRTQFLQKFSYCAVAMSEPGCSLTFTAEGGRNVEFFAGNVQGHRPAKPAICSFVCMPK